METLCKTCCNGACPLQVTKDRLIVSCIEYIPGMMIGEIADRLKENELASEAKPVNHGRWEETHISLCKWIPEDDKEEGHSFYMAEMKCSCCKRYNTVTFVLTLNKPDFCQLCGARMMKDGDAE